MNLSRIYLVSIVFLITISATSSATDQQPAPVYNSSLTVSVYDAFTGVPIEDAPVQIVGNAYIKLTDSDGRVTFTPMPGDPSGPVRIWTTPEGYAPGAAEIVYTQMNEIASIAVVPEDAFTTGLIDPAVGGTFVFTDTVHGWKTRPFYMEIIVPPNALNQPASINFSWYPTWAAFSNGIPEDRMLLGIIYLSLKDAQGDKISETLNAPVTFKARPYFTDGFQGIDVNDLVISRYNYDTHEFDTIGTATGVDLQNELVIYELSQFSIGCCHSKTPTSPPAPPGKPIISESRYCTNGGVEVNVTCGEYNENGSLIVEKGTSATVSQSLRTALEAQYGANIGIALSTIEMKCKLSLAYKAGQSLTASTTKQLKLTVGAKKAWDKCYTGRCMLTTVYSETSVSVPGAGPVGTIDQPTAVTRKVTEYRFDPSCPGCENTLHVPRPKSACDDLPMQ